MYLSDTVAKLRHQEMLQQAEAWRKTKHLHAGNPQLSVLRRMLSAIGYRAQGWSSRVEESTVPARANHAQIEIDSGVFNI